MGHLNKIFYNYMTEQDAWDEYLGLLKDDEYEAQRTPPVDPVGPVDSNRLESTGNDPFYRNNAKNGNSSLDNIRYI